jgi:hypothetical protein
MYVVQQIEKVPAALHDAEVVAVEVIRKDKFVSLNLLSDCSEIWRIEFGDVLFIRADDFVFQNVVSRLLISSIFEFSNEQLFYWIKWISSLNDTGSSMSVEQMVSYQRKVESGDLVLFVLEPSWGMEFAVISREIRCFRQDRMSAP